MSRRGERPSPETLATLPVAVDAMGGDKAPAEIVEGARRAAEDHGVGVVLVGPPELVGDTKGLDLVACTEVIAMDEDPAGGVRRKKDSSLVRAAELVRDGKASAMVSAGNTGATMASALLRMGRLPGVVRPCIATPLPRLGRTPAVLVDAGANAECTAAMLLQFAQMGAAYVSARFGTASPSVGLLSIGEEATKGTPLVKETHGLLAEAATPASGRDHRRTAGTEGFEFVGNLEGRDLLPSPADVIVTDGFTGNVTLKALEGSLRFLFDTLLGVFGTDDATRKASVGAAPAPAAPGGPIRAGEHGRGDAARHRRGLRHQPRFLQRNRHDECRPGGARMRRQGPGGPCGGRRAIGRDSVNAQVRGAKRAVRPLEDLHLSCASRNPHQPGPPRPQGVFELIRDQLADILETDPSSITEGASFVEDLDADSLALIELVEALEEELGERTVGFRIDDEDLEDLRTVRDAVDYVYAKLEAG